MNSLIYLPEFFFHRERERERERDRGREGEGGRDQSSRLEPISAGTRSDGWIERILVLAEPTLPASIDRLSPSGGGVTPSLSSKAVLR